MQRLDTGGARHDKRREAELEKNMEQGRGAVRNQRCEVRKQSKSFRATCAPLSFKESADCSKTHNNMKRGQRAAKKSFSISSEHLCLFLTEGGKETLRFSILLGRKAQSRQRTVWTCYRGIQRKATAPSTLNCRYRGLFSLPGRLPCSSHSLRLGQSRKQLNKTPCPSGK